jgi:protein-L-isoaspartate O-methyltransferase
LHISAILAADSSNETQLSFLTKNPHFDRLEAAFDMFERHFHLANNFSGPPIMLALIEASNSNQVCCKTFITEDGGYQLWGKPVEWSEWMLVEAIIDHGSRVLEFGARYGTTSCILARATGNVGAVVSVEIDSNVWGSLRTNRDKHNCSFHIVEGGVGDGTEYNI